MTEAGDSTVLEGTIGPWYFDLVREELDGVGSTVPYLMLRPTIEACLAGPRNG